MNKQNIAAQFDGSETPCPDLSKKINGSLMDAVSHVVETSQPASIPVADGDDLYIISEQAYKYFLSKCTEDELWDLGFLGQSEKHARPVDVSILRKLAKSL